MQVSYRVAVMRAMGGVILATLFWLAAWKVSWMLAPQSSTPVLHSPNFHAKQCFLSNNPMPREPWSPPVDGIVQMVGYNHYLVMFAAEADRRFAGPKEGWAVNIEEFDSHYHLTTCPTGWVTH